MELEKKEGIDRLDELVSGPITPETVREVNVTYFSLSKDERIQIEPKVTQFLKDYHFSKREVKDA